MSFDFFAICMHCGAQLNENGYDRMGMTDCFDDYGYLVGVHDYDLEYPLGVDEDGEPI